MKGYVEFTGKTLDEAIKSACDYFGVAREKLEIEIVNDAKTGIFGLVGAKKASLRARRVQLQDIGLNFGDEPKGRKGEKKPEGGRNGQAAQASQSAQSSRNGSASASGKKRGRDAERGENPERTERPEKADCRERSDEIQLRPESALEVHKTNLPSLMVADAQSDGGAASSRSSGGESSRESSGRNGGRKKPASERGGQPPEPGQGARQEKKGARDENRRERPGRGRQGAAGAAASANDERPAKKSAPKADRAEGRPESESSRGNADFTDELADFADQLPVVPLESVDQELLQSTVLEALQRLVTPIVGEIECSFSLDEGRVRVQVSCGDNCGLLIGRDGQTLSALQYLLSCMASRRLNVSVRVQIDAGDYREKQDEKLRELALSLAQKVKSSSRPQSTRPLSAYHRRIIHMTLQDDPQVQTHSKGEGGLKRVVVVPRRK